MYTDLHTKVEGTQIGLIDDSPKLCSLIAKVGSQYDQALDSPLYLQNYGT